MLLLDGILALQPASRAASSPREEQVRLGQGEPEQGLGGAAEKRGRHGAMCLDQRPLARQRPASHRAALWCRGLKGRR